MPFYVLNTCRINVQVESVFTLSISELLDPSFRIEEDLGTRGLLPAFTAGPSRVWGLTAVITDGVLREGIAPLLEDWLLAEDTAKGDAPRLGPRGSSL